MLHPASNGQAGTAPELAWPAFAAIPTGGEQLPARLGAIAAKAGQASSGAVPASPFEAGWSTSTQPCSGRLSGRAPQFTLGDEMGLRSDHQTGTCWAPKGQTPVLETTGQRFGCNLVVVTAAQISDQAGARQLFQKLQPQRRWLQRLALIWADGAYQGHDFLKWVFDTYRWILEVVLRQDQQPGFWVVQKRWVVEHTFGWLHSLSALE